MKKMFMILFMGIIFVSGCDNTENSREKESLNGNENDEVEINNNEQSGDETKEFDFTIDGIISPEDFQISEESFQIDPGKEDLHIITNWVPSGARVIFGFINAQTEEEFWETPIKSGSWQGIIKTSHLKAGEYYIAIKTEPEINDYDKRDRTIIAHFNWK